MVKPTKISYHLSFGYCTSHGYIYKAVVVHTVGYKWKNSDFMGGISKLSELFYSKNNFKYLWHSLIALFWILAYTVYIVVAEEGSVCP